MKEKSSEETYLSAGIILRILLFRILKIFKKFPAVNVGQMVPDRRRRHYLVSNLIRMTLTSFSVSRQEARLRVCMNTLLAIGNVGFDVNCCH